jgi:hypothetical protein
VGKASNAFFLWPKELLEEQLNRTLLAHLVQHDLFTGHQAGWECYVEKLRSDVPWFGADLGLVPGPDLEPTKATWPPASSTDEPPLR